MARGRANQPKQESLTSHPAYRKVIAALSESEERYRALVEGVRRYAIYMLDPKGIIQTWNKGIKEVLGYDREEIGAKGKAMEKILRKSVIGDK